MIPNRFKFQIHSNPLISPPHPMYICIIYTYIYIYIYIYICIYIVCLVMTRDKCLGHVFAALAFYGQCWCNIERTYSSDELGPIQSVGDLNFVATTCLVEMIIPQTKACLRRGSYFSCKELYHISRNSGNQR